MFDLVAGLSLGLLLIVVVVTAWASYRRHARRAQARSRAALNRLLAEADEIAQRSAPADEDDTPAT
jgi:uncharacterized membrane protein